VVIHDLNVVGIAVLPPKAHPKLVDADAVLARSVLGQLFEPIVRRRSQVVELRRGMQHREFPLSHSAEVAREALRRSAVKNTAVAVAALQMAVC
jgi:hypothetical protein